MTEERFPPPWSTLLGRLIVREGGYVNNPADVGGPTNFGITQSTLSVARATEATAHDVKMLRPDEAMDIYWIMWVRHPSMELDQLAHVAQLPLLEMVLDTSVLFGRMRAGKWLQMSLQACGRAITVDGWIGPETRHAVAVTENYRLVERMLMYRIKRHVRRVEEDFTQAQFLTGWINRAFEVAGMNDT